MNLENFYNTHSFFEYIQKCLQEGRANDAGKLWEEFTCEKFLQEDEYIAVYNTNDFASIPNHILQSTNSFRLLSLGIKSFGIDKFLLTRYGDIDVVQDKSSLHLDRNLGTDKASKMMSLRDNPLKGIRNFIISTTARDLSHYKNVWENQTPICYGGDYYLPDLNNPEAKERDRLFWENIRFKKENKPTVNILGFQSRGPAQDVYIKDGKEYGLKQLQATGYATWFQLGVGSLGKSVLDPIILGSLENQFNSAYTSTPAPVNISFYHSSKTLPKNGLEEVQRRRAMGIYDEVIVLSGTSVKEDIKTIFFMTTSVSEASVRIINALSKNKSVLILTLYHHAESVAMIKNLLNKHYKGFKFWYRKRDETDWACSNQYSRYAAAYDNRTESVLTFGSSGTERIGNAIVDYGTNNISIHGPCTHVFSWGNAENNNLVKKLKLLLPAVKESEVAQLFPQYIDKNGRIDWNMRIDGIAVEGEYPTIDLIANLVCLAKVLNEYPEIKRMLGFANTRKQNKLAEVNFPWVAKKILGINNNSKRVIGLFFQTLNDDFDSSTIQNHDWAIKQAKSHDYYLIGGCKLFSRGYDDTLSPKHHAGIHWDKKNIVDTSQEIWRFTRLDNDEQGKTICGDPFAYYILPMRYNDLGDTPSWSEDRLSILQGILLQNKNIFTEFESLAQNPLAKRQRGKTTSDRCWIPEHFDVKLFSNLVTTILKNNRDILHQNLFIEAHTWLLTEYIKLPKLNSVYLHPINYQWSKDPKWKSIRDMYVQGQINPLTFRGRFWNGYYAKTYGCEAEQHIQNNLLSFKLHKERLKEKKDIQNRQLIQEMSQLLSSVLHAEGNYFKGFSKKISEKYSIPIYVVIKLTKDIRNKWLNDHEHYRKQKLKAYNLIFQTAEDDIGVEKWFQKIIDRWNETGIQGNLTFSLFRDKFLKDWVGVLTEEQKLELKKCRDKVNRAGKDKPKNFKSWNNGLTTKTSNKLIEIGLKISKSLKNRKKNNIKKQKFLNKKIG